MKWQVLDEKGIFYTTGASSRRKVFAKNSFILPIDIEKDHITEGGIATLIKLKRLKAVTENKAESEKAIIKEKKIADCTENLKKAQLELQKAEGEFNDSKAKKDGTEKENHKKFDEAVVNVSKAKQALEKASA